MYTLAPNFCHNLLQQYNFLGKYFNSDALQNLLDEGLKKINEKTQDSENILISDIKSLNDLLQRSFIREQGVERIDFPNENITKEQQNLLRQLLEISIYNSSKEENLENPVILGGTYNGMKHLLNLSLTKPVNGQTHFLTSDRPFYHNECDSGKITQIIAEKNALNEEKTLQIEALIKQHFSSTLQAKPNEMALKRIIMYLQIIDMIKNTSYHKELEDLLIETKGDFTKIPPSKRIEIITNVYSNVSCLATEKDLAVLLIKEKGLDIEKCNIIMAKTNPGKQDRATTADTYTAFRASSLYSEDKKYTLVTLAGYGLRQAMEFEKCMGRPAYFIAKSDEITLTLKAFYDDLARTLYTALNLIQEKESKTINKNLSETAKAGVTLFETGVCAGLQNMEESSRLSSQFANVNNLTLKITTPEVSLPSNTPVSGTRYA